MVKEISEDIVIAGLACRLPESDNAEEFWSHLMNKEDMITDDGRRWTPGLHGLPKRSGKLKDIKKFDAQFFSVHAKQANKMDPQLRILLELTYESLIDAGVNPQTVRNSRTGVFIGASGSEASEANSAIPEEINGYGLVGGCRAMFSNRVSFTFDFKGPSYTIDTACSSSLLAMDCAVQSIRSGACDAAIVGGVNLTLKPNNSVDFLRLNMLSADGKCKSFDASGSGYVRSEGAVCIYLQKKHVSKRIYAHVVNSKTNSDGFKTQGVTYPSGDVQKQLLQEVYAEALVNPSDVSYIEAHGTGTKAGDPEEVNSITDVFCSGRKAGNSLLIGSVKSNMGHSEPASGLAGVAKVVLAMQHGALPPNLHFENPNADIPALHDGRLKVVTEITKWEGGIVGINSFGFGGSNVHVILRSPEEVTTSLLKGGVQTCITASGRTEDGVKELLTLARENCEDGLLSLLADISLTPHNTFPYRGFAIINNGNQVENIKKVSSSDRPLWYVFAGMGAQWSGMGRKMMVIPTFRQSIQNTGKYLKEYNFNLEQLLLESDEDGYKHILNSFVGTAAIQVALVDCLRAVGLHPDGIVGHSVGELGCAYADNSFTAEEVIKAAYWRGRCVSEAQLPPGAMAAVGLTWEEAKVRCPPGVIPACHNSLNTITISGEAGIMSTFLQELRDEEVFVKEVNTSNIAFHSHYMAMIAPILLSSLEKFIVPKRRSDKWLSTSIPEEKWDNDLAQYSSAEYHVNNLVSPVLFQEVLKKIPSNAIVVEIAPHCLLQAVLRRSLSEECVIVPLMKKHHQDNLEFFLSNLGNIYMAGRNLDPTTLTCNRQYPVPLHTPSIAPSVKWDHSQEWDIPKLEQFSSGGGGAGVNSFKFDIDISPNSNDNYLEGHCIDGRVLFPATGYLVLAWRALAKKMGLMQENLGVTFEDVHIHRATILSKTGTVTLTVHLLPASNKFEVSEGESLTVSGKIFPLEEEESSSLPMDGLKLSEEHLLTSQCIYKELRLRGYDYGPTFQGVKEANSEATQGKLIWNNNWVTFLDAMLQMSVLRLPGHSLRLPTRIRSLQVDPAAHLQLISNGSCNIEVNGCLDTVVAGGVKICGLHATVAPKRQDNQTAILESYTHVPYIRRINVNTKLNDIEFSQILKEGNELKTMIDIVMENLQKTTLKVCEISAAMSQAYRHVSTLVSNQPLMQLKYMATDKSQELVTGLENSVAELGMETCVWDPRNKAPNSIGKIDLLISSKISDGDSVLEILRNVKSTLNPQGFLLVHDVYKEGKMTDTFEQEGFLLVSSVENLGDTQLQLYRLQMEPVEKPCIMDIDSTFGWVEGLKSEMNKGSGPSIWLRAETLLTSGIIGMVNCLRKESGGERIRCIFDVDGAGRLLMECFEELCQLDLVMNIRKNGEFGSYRHVHMEKQGNFVEKTEHAYVNVLTRGDLSSLRWIASPLKYAGKTLGNVELCTVSYTSLNFRDIMLATGKLPPDALPGNLSQQDCILGMEFSGMNPSGKRIMGLLPAQALATTVLADQRFTWEVPDGWSLADAATVPVVYSTAYYSLFVRGRLRHGESVLIHSGSGGVGQAAISICLSIGCDVYTTCGTKEKKQYLLSRFPKLDCEKIGNSRDLSFESMVMCGTKGKGVDIVLNSLSEEKLQASVRCLARHGRFLEIGKYDLSNNSPLGMAIFLKNISFHGILLDAIFEEGNHEWKEVANLVSMGIKSGTVRPLNATLFQREEIEPAFRFMAQGKHIGKVVIQVRNDQALHSSIQLKAQARSMCDPAKSYLITGGLGGFGLELADWLISRGARKLILTSRRGIRTGYQARKIKNWREQGIDIKLSTSDVGTKEGAGELIKESQTLALLGGIFHLAAVLKDAIFENQTTTMFSDVCKPKYDGTVYLDRLTRREDIAKGLNWFVVFSSVVSGRGNTGQANYGYANSGMERICEKRVKDGLPGLAIQWGAIGDVGLVQETMGGTNDTVVGGTLPQRISNCMSCLDHFLQQTHPVVSSYVLAAKQTSKGDKASTGDIVSSIARILGISDPTTINPDTTLGDLGLDSLMGVEIKQMLERDYDIQMKANEIRLQTLNTLRNLGEDRAPGTDAEDADKGDLTNEVNDKTVDIMRVVEIPTYSEKTLVKLNDIDYGEQQPIFIVHNIYGTVEPLRHIGKLLSCPVYGLQYTKDAPTQSVEELASFYIRHIKEVVGHGVYRIVGYSFGATIALEMSLRLKKDGQEVNLIMLEGSQKYVSSYSVLYRERYNVSTDFEATVDTLVILAEKVAKVDKMNLRNTLMGLSTMQSQINETFNAIMKANRNLDNKEFVLSYITYFMNLLRMGEQYSSSSKYSGNIKVIRAKIVDRMSSHLGDDLGVKEICDASVTISWVEGDHLSVLHGHGADEIANIITASQ